MGGPFAIELAGVRKSFPAPRRELGYTTLKTALVGLVTGRRARAPRVEVLRGVDLRVPPGECLGLIGRNGSGKTTLLKVVAGIYRPTSGRVEVRGRVSALIELGAGFHPEFTGRENVLLNGMILGLTRREIRRRFDDIVAFAELAEVIDNPVRTYSSGMYMRLAFSVAVHVDPEVMLVDEVLAVGDNAFVRKCQARIEALRARGTTMLLVTHDMGAVQRWCNRAMLLAGGEVVAQGEPREVVSRYLEGEGG